MDFQVWIASKDDGLGDRVAALLQEEGFPLLRLRTMEALFEAASENAASVVLIDLDTVPVDARSISRLRSFGTGCQLLGASKRRIHPELREAIRDHFFACMGNPPDPVELTYLIGALFRDASQEWG